MPDLFLNSTTYSGDATVLATEQGLRSPRMLTLDLTYFPADSNGQKILKPGSLITKLSSGLGRVFPATKATAATATSSPTLTVADASLFKAGDTIKKTSTGGTTIGTVQSINTSANTVTLAANAAAAVANGDTLVATDGGDVTSVWGMVLSRIDLLQTSNDVACYTSASVYGARLPFWSSTVQAQLPEITLV